MDYRYSLSTFSRTAVISILSIEWLMVSLVLIFFCVLFGLLQFQTPALVGNDGYYHIKIAWLLKEQAFAFRFDWLPLTILNAESFVDHHFLFHLLLIPFTALGLVAGAKLAATFFAALAFTSVWWLLRTYKVIAPFFWAVVLAIVSDAFLYRMMMPRAQSLALALLALCLIWLHQGRQRMLALGGFLFVWLFNGYPLILVVVLLFALVMWLVQRNIEIAPLVYLFIGLLAGLVINPFFPNNLEFSLAHIVPKVLDPVAVKVGNEWYPWTTQTLLDNAGAVIALLVSAMAIWGVRGDATNRSRDLFLFSLVALTGFMLFRSRRFIEYFAPMAVIFSASVISPVLRNWWEQVTGRKRYLPLILVASFVSILGWATFGEAIDTLQGSNPLSRFESAGQWLRTNTPAGSMVFHSDWDDFTRLFFYDHHNTYIVGLDPTYLSLAERDLYEQWVEITRGRVANPAAIIHDQFGGDYVLIEKDHVAFIQKALQDPDLELVYQDGDVMIFQNGFER